jgi:hypothetical protein
MPRWFWCLIGLFWSLWSTSAADLFLPFERANPHLHRLQEFVAEVIALPDRYMALDTQRYLVIVTQTSPIGQGLYFVDMERKYTAKVLGGVPDIPAFSVRAGEPLWLLVSAGGMTRGVMWTQFSALQWHRDLQGHRTFQHSWLVYGKEDGESGACGSSRERAKSIGLDKASIVNAYVLKDLNGDGVDDISFAITEVDCTTGEKTEATKNYLFSQQGFQEQP